ncbi:hypothetical protein [Paenibacillus durus]|uniref:Uncharacterized protein n=1 Tax=Paenibacillus durus ATCC 35681 TaxID=1333534 RepID=A0A0F7FBC3_PAEDU|nr:hypothetical protein [Paenibacillus durus]AKG36068.1 hypothetical protein VK70_17140 [Paenibacillus durus ATCC 35681]
MYTITGRKFEINGWSNDVGTHMMSPPIMETTPKYANDSDDAVKAALDMLRDMKGSGMDVVEVYNDSSNADDMHYIMFFGVEHDYGPFKDFGVEVGIYDFELFKALLRTEPDLYREFIMDGDRELSEDQWIERYMTTIEGEDGGQEDATGLSVVIRKGALSEIRVERYNRCDWEYYSLR